MKAAKKGIWGWTAVTLAVLAVFCTWRPELGRKGQALIVLAGGALTAVLLWIDREIRKKERKPERIFLMLFIPISLAMMIALPLFRAPDEPAHLIRIWQISIGQWIPNSRNEGVFYEPSNLIWGEAEKITLKQLAETAAEKMDMENLVVSSAGANTGFYPINNYFPQALGMALVRLVTKNRLAILYGARFGGWLATLLLLYYAVKKIPAGKNLLIAMALTPMFLQEAISASADGITCAATAAFLAMILQLRTQKERCEKKQYLEIFLLTFCVCTFKMFYCPLALLLLSVPEECFGGKKEKRKVLFWIAVIILGMIGAWMLICLKNYIVPSTSAGNGIIDQVKWILRHPLGYLAVLGRTIVNNFGRYANGVIGDSLSWFNITIPSLLPMVQMFTVWTIAIHDRRLKETLRMRLNIMALSAVSVLAIFTSLYAWWNPYANEWIYGIQGRYFLPLLPGVVLAALPNGAEDESIAENGLVAMALTDVCVWVFVWISTVV